MSPSPATVPAGFSPASSMGSEMAGSAVAMTPDQMLAAKQDQAQQRAAVYVGKTQFQINNELAQEQHAQDKRAAIMRS